MSGNRKTSVVEIWMGLIILCLVVGEVSAKSCELKCAIKCGFIFFKCFEDCVNHNCASSGSVVSMAAGRCAFTCTKQKCAKFEPGKEWKQPKSSSLLSTHTPFSWD